MADGDDTSGWRQWVLPIVVALAAALVTSLVVVLVAGGDDDSTAVLLEPAAEAGLDPFSPSVAVASAPALAAPAEVAAEQVRAELPADPATGTLVAEGTTPGLYGGSQDLASCDPAQLVAFLRANPAQATAWASVIGISREQIGPYVGSLTPVVLTADTWVTNHGFENGTATPRQAVLQSGTAVLVDAGGTPRVKCNCGNPLAPPANGDLAAVSTSGTTWSGYAPRRVAVVRTAAPIANLALLDVASGEVYEQPVGVVGPIREGVIDLRTDGVHIEGDDDVVPYTAGRDAVVAALDDVLGEPTGGRTIPTDGICVPETQTVEWTGVTVEFWTGADRFRISATSDGLAPERWPSVQAAGDVDLGESFAAATAAHPTGATSRAVYEGVLEQGLLAETVSENYGVVARASGGVIDGLAALTDLEDLC